MVGLERYPASGRFDHQRGSDSAMTGVVIHCRAARRPGEEQARAQRSHRVDQRTDTGPGDGHGGGRPVRPPPGSGRCRSTIVVARLMARADALARGRRRHLQASDRCARCAHHRACRGRENRNAPMRGRGKLAAPAI
jgi:hypothetical protein